MLLDSRPVWLYDGPMETRIQFGTDFKLDPEMSIFTLVESASGRSALSALYERDARAAARYRLPIVLNAPIYRASPAHLARLSFTAPGDLVRINRDCLDLVRDLVSRLDRPQDTLITAPIGPRFAAYQPDRQSTLAQAIDYHTPQIEAVAAWGVELISIAAMHGGVETVAAATVAARTGVPYTVGFVLTADGKMLDGTPVWTLIAEIDATVAPGPELYVIGCTHPTVCEQVLALEHAELARIRGVKANGSSKPPEELLELRRAEADPPEEFADELLALGRPRGFRLYGGCCGTDTALIDSLGKRLTDKNRQARGEP
jgi:homocysteine S-methyltransferase